MPFKARHLAILGLLVPLALAGCNEKPQQQAPQAAAQRPEVGVVVLQPQSVAITAELPGRTSASLVAEVRPQIGGIIQKRLFKEGSEVKAGDPMYQIDPASYQAAYDSAVAALQKTEAAVPSAQAKLDRYEGLIKQKAISEQDYDDAKAALLEAKADVAAAKADVETARINLNYTTIRAPISGRADASTLTVGALVTASQTTALTTVRTLDPINVDVTQSSTNLLNLRKSIKEGRVKTSGDNVKVRLRLENGMEYDESGKLEFSEANVDETTGTYTVRAEFPNPDRLLLPGMYVRAYLEEGIAENSYLVPERAVTRDVKGNATALFVDKDNKIEQRTLTVDRNIGNNWLVTTGIKPGDRVVVEGSQFAGVGQEVAPVEVTIDENTGEVESRKQSSLSSDQTMDVANAQAPSSKDTASTRD